MAVRSALARARHAAALFAVGLAFLLPSVVFAQAATWVSADGATMHFKGLDGRTATLAMPKGLPPAANGTGGVLLKATQNVAIGSAAATFNLSRTVSAANLAAAIRAAGLISGFGTALALTGLVYEGLQLLDGMWVKPGDDGPIPGKLWNAATVNGSTNLGTNYVNHGGSCTAETAGPCSYGQFVADAQAVCNSRAAAYPGGACTAFSAWAQGPTLFVNWQITRDNGAPVGLTISAASPANNPNPPDPIPASEAEAIALLEAALTGDPPKAAAVATAVAGYVPVEQWVKESVVAQGPATVDGGTVTQTETTSQGTTTRTTATTYQVTYQGDTITINQGDTITTTYPDQSVSTTTVNTTQPTQPNPQAAEPPEDLECGLPGTPKCAIDETGTPQAQDTVSAGQQALDAAWQARDEQVASETAVESLGWQWSLPTLTSSCAPVQVGSIMSVDVCPAADIGRIGTSFLWSVLAGLYCWRRLVGAVEGGV